MKTLRTLLVVVALTLACGLQSASAQSAGDAYRREVSTLLELTNVKNTLSQTLVSTYTSMGILNQEKADIVVNEWLTQNWDKMTDIYSDVYKKYFTLNELKELVAFYRTPIGKKFSYYSTQIVMDAQLKFKDDPALTASLQQLLMQYMR